MNADAGCHLTASSPSMAHTFTATDGGLWHPWGWPSDNYGTVHLLSLSATSTQKCWKFILGWKTENSWVLFWAYFLLQLCFSMLYC